MALIITDSGKEGNFLAMRNLLCGVARMWSELPVCGRMNAPSHSLSVIPVPSLSAVTVAGRYRYGFGRSVGRRGALLRPTRRWLTQGS
jgi:hypothetical protein